MEDKNWAKGSTEEQLLMAGKERGRQQPQQDILTEKNSWSEPGFPGSSHPDKAAQQGTHRKVKKSIKKDVLGSG